MLLDVWTSHRWDGSLRPQDYVHVALRALSALAARRACEQRLIGKLVLIPQDADMAWIAAVVKLALPRAMQPEAKETLNAAASSDV